MPSASPAALPHAGEPPSASEGAAAKRPRATEATLDHLRRARALLAPAASEEEAVALIHLAACIAALEPSAPPRALPVLAAAAASSATDLPPLPHRSQQTQTQNLSSQQTAGTQADGTKCATADASSQVVPALAHAASQACAVQSVAETQAGSSTVLGQRSGLGQWQENRC